MKNKIGVILVVGIICFVLLFSGFWIGKIVYENKANYDSETNESYNNENNNSTEMNKQEQMAIGRYLYFLGDAFFKNCRSSYFELENPDGRHFYVNNYGEILNSFDDEFKQKYPKKFDSSCPVKVDDNKYDLSCSWCGSGSLITKKFNRMHIVSAESDKITFSVSVTEIPKDSAGEITDYDDTFIIKYVDNMWKINEYTYRGINSINGIN